MTFFDDDAGYDLNDPKHSTFHERYADLWDNRDKGENPKYGPGNPDWERDFEKDKE
jgi:hypothetical protein